jgi:hypothetical protein
MSDLTAKFTDLESQLAAQQTDLIAGMVALNDSLGLILTALDTLNSNGATNTRYLLNALASIDPCLDCGTVSPVVPSIGDEVSPFDEETCKRVQAFIATINAFAAGYTTMQSYNVSATVSIINSTIGTVIAGISGTDTVPLPSFPETVNLVGDYFNSAAAHIFDSETPSSSFALVAGDMQDALFAAGDTPAMQSAYNSIIDGSSMTAADKLLLKATAYNALWAYFFDPASDPDLSGYDGGVCSFPAGTCFTIDLVAQSYSNGSSVVGVGESFGPFTVQSSINTSSGEVTSTPPAFFDGNLSGWTIEVLIGSAFVTYRTGDRTSSGLFTDTSLYSVDGIAHALPAPTGSFFIRGASGARIRICST